MRSVSLGRTSRVGAMPTQVMAAPDVGDEAPASPVAEVVEADPSMNRALVDGIQQLVQVVIDDGTPQGRNQVVAAVADQLGRQVNMVARSLAEGSVGRCFRTKPCKYFCKPDGKKCQYGDRCQFHHRLNWPGGPWDFHQQALCKDDQPYACRKCGLNMGPVGINIDCLCNEAEEWFAKEENVSTAAEDSAAEEDWMEDAAADGADAAAADQDQPMPPEYHAEPLYFNNADEEVLARTRRDRVPCLFVHCWCRLKMFVWS